MKTTLRIFLLVLALVPLLSCARKERIYESLCHGIYDGLILAQQNRDLESVPPPGKEPPTYEQYKREREEMLKGREDSSIP